ncbi:Zinc finger protein [Plakobranchus ocellatus]|uniref:Zinc finger protein n=1 Tax=Plakobranchus ocellatus TaxID=259542 RepID=A0AAV4AKH0_9GAST|nr:Zinc finger protein [Plakobranchus ocellatus]
MVTMEEIVKQADLLGYRGEKREEYLKQEFKFLAERQEKKEEAEPQEGRRRKKLIARKDWRRALDCYGRLLAEQAKDYDKVKEALMKMYDLTENGYRRKFRTCKPAEEKRFNGGQRAGEAKTSVADQRSCFKCKKTGHIAQYCTTVDSTTKKAAAGVVVKTTEVNTAEVRKPAESPTMEEVCRLLGIKQKTTTPYHTMCNGLVERFNTTLKTCLRRLCSEQPRQWHRYINPLLFAYREVPQESTHFAPFELLYGRTVRGPMHILRELWTKEIEEPDVKSS